MSALRRTLTPLLADGNELDQVRKQLVRLVEDFMRAKARTLTLPYRGDPPTRCELVFDPHTWEHLHMNLAAHTQDSTQWDAIARIAEPLGVSLVLGEQS